MAINLIFCSIWIQSQWTLKAVFSLASPILETRFQWELHSFIIEWPHMLVIINFAVTRRRWSYSSQLQCGVSDRASAQSQGNYVCICVKPVHISCRNHHKSYSWSHKWELVTRPPLHLLLWSKHFQIINRLMLCMLEFDRHWWLNQLFEVCLTENQ